MTRTEFTTRRRSAIYGIAFLAWWGAVAPSWNPSTSQESRFAKTGSRSGYLHRIELRDVDKSVIDPGAENPPPYSPTQTCGKCHDVELIHQGYHFNPWSSPNGRPGEPWIYVDQKTGMQLPLSYRGWEKSFAPDEFGLSTRDFFRQFARQLPGLSPPSELPSQRPRTRRRSHTSFWPHRGRLHGLS